ncbi:hypothetical protein HAX54_037485, partial [Datura stramonium]|nr:hypothetical protein [Datura stramonium]
MTREIKSCPEGCHVTISLNLTTSQWSNSYKAVMTSGINSYHELCTWPISESLLQAPDVKKVTNFTNSRVKTSRKAPTYLEASKGTFGNLCT